MKRVLYLLVCLFITIPMWGQSPVAPQKDSTILQIKALLSKNAQVGRYKVYPTTNTYNSLKLDTATGRVTALQIGMNSDSNRMEYLICEALEDEDADLTIGRYSLYPTNNNYNFILLDTITGKAYQVQWSTKASECGRWRIW